MYTRAAAVMAVTIAVFVIAGTFLAVIAAWPEHSACKVHAHQLDDPIEACGQ